VTFGTTGYTFTDRYFEDDVHDANDPYLDPAPTES